MTQYINILILLFVCFRTLESVTQKKPYTILTYIAGDNSLEPFIDGNVRSMHQGYNENANILSFVNRKKNNKKIAQQLVIKEKRVEQDGETFYNLDSGNISTVIKAVEWAFINYPAEHYVLILWDHGSGSLNRCVRAVCYDDTTGSYLKDIDLVSIMKKTCETIGKKLDILAFDACLMADIEIAYILSNYADYMVASQETIPGYGFDYNGLISSLKFNILNPRDFTKASVFSYNNFYQNTNNTFTLSSIDLSRIPELTNSLNKISEYLISLLQMNQNKHIIYAIINAASPHKATRFDEPDYLDLANFLKNLYNNIQHITIASDIKFNLKKEILNCLRGIQDTIIANVKCKNLPEASGLSIYFPLKSVDLSYKSLIWYDSTNWGKFLSKFFKSLK